MISDVDISNTFQIPSRMVQKWKNSNDYKYLVYMFLKLSKKRDIELFFNYLLTPDRFDKDKLTPLSFTYKDNFINKSIALSSEIIKLIFDKNKIEFDNSINFISFNQDKYMPDKIESTKYTEYKYDEDTNIKDTKSNNEKVNSFMMLNKNTNEVVKTKKEIVYSDDTKDVKKFKNLDYILKDNEHISPLISAYSFFVVYDENKIIYLELCSKVQEEKPLREKTKEIKKSLKDDYTLTYLLFITSEKNIPLYLKNKLNNMIEKDIYVYNIDTDLIAKEFLKAKKIIFVPKELSIPQDNTPSNISTEGIEYKIIYGLKAIYDNVIKKYDFKIEYGIKDIFNYLCSMFKEQNIKNKDDLDTYILSKKFIKFIEDKIKEYTPYQNEEAIDELYKTILLFLLDLNNDDIMVWIDKNNHIKNRFYNLIE